MKIVIKNIEVWNPFKDVQTRDLFIENDRIEAVLDGPIDFELDGQNLIAMPGFIDIHIHGAMGGDVMDATKDALDAISVGLAMEGTTSFLATTMTQSEAAIEAAIEALINYESVASEILGIHIEGPFVNKDRAGAQPVEYIQNPDKEKLIKWQQLSNHKIKVITIAPELVEDDFIEVAVAHDIVVSAGHTDATATQLKEAQESGLKSITHLFNQMRALHHREIGAIGEALANDELYCEIIADFVHSSEDAVRFAYRNKGPEKLILITDAMRAKGLAPGDYELGGQKVIVDKDARLVNGALAGSILKMNEAVKNMAKFNLSPQELVKISSTNACHLLNLSDRGHIDEKYKADIVILTKNFEVVMTIKNGQIIYRNVN